VTSLGGGALIETLSGGTALVTGTVTNGGIFFASGSTSVKSVIGTSCHSLRVESVASD